jgi:hypothetical protein
MVLGLSLAVSMMANGPVPGRTEIQARASKCGFIFYADAPRAGDGIFISKDSRTLFLQTRRHESKKRQCLATWAREHGLKVRYIPPPPDDPSKPERGS